MKHYFLIVSVIAYFLFSKCTNQPQFTHDKPNILWISCEDITTMIRAYGDQIAVTPNIDNLAKKGVLFENAYSTAPVCSPARSCLVTGIYATTLGTQNLRSDFKIPDFIKTLPHILRENGYYCTNNSKEDYNFYDSTIWDESSNQAHWRNRPDNKPFYSVFNIETTHQSQIFGNDETFFNKYGKQLTDEERTDPESIPLKPYYFDTPQVRKLWSRYYDLVALMDRKVGEILEQLKEDKLDENTIVFFYSDHGTGMPRAKRALYNSGVKVPFIVYIPEKYQNLVNFTSGSSTDEIVSFVDFPPTVLSLLDLKIPEYMQGKAFLGKNRAETRDFAFATSDRVDEAFEISRTVKGKDYSYIRNFLPHLPLIQPNFYTDQSEIMKELRRLKTVTDMTPAQKSMWLPRRAPEELYDLENDPDEINNLALDSKYKPVLLKMRSELNNWIIRTRDTGLIPEGYLLDQCIEQTAYEVSSSDSFYPINEILSTTDFLLEEENNWDELIALLDNKKMMIRYWATISLQYNSNPSEAVIYALNNSLSDPSIYVQLAASETLCAFDECNPGAQQSILKGLQSKDKMVALLASRIFELNKNKAEDIEEEAKLMMDKFCKDSSGKWQGYDLYSCWALNEAFKN